MTDTPSLWEALASKKTGIIELFLFFAWQDALGNQIVTVNLLFIYWLDNMNLYFWDADYWKGFQVYVCQYIWISSQGVSFEQTVSEYF